jgi:hypothetical protein
MTMQGWRRVQFRAQFLVQALVRLVPGPVVLAVLAALALGGLVLAVVLSVLVLAALGGLWWLGLGLLGLESLVALALVGPVVLVVAVLVALGVVAGAAIQVVLRAVVAAARRCRQEVRPVR